MPADAPKEPWWRKGLFAALLGATIPLATFVQGWWQKERELELQERQQLQQIRLAYMNLMLEGGMERVQTLADFIADTEQDPGIRAWAAKQRDKARQTVADLEQKIADEQKRAVGAENERREAEERAARAEALARRLAEANASQEQREQARKAALEAQAALARAEASARASQSKVARTRETLQGRIVPRADTAAQNALPPQVQMALPPDGVREGRGLLPR